MSLKDVAGLTLTPPRLVYEAEDPAWGSATLTRPHLARTLDGGTLTLRLTEGDRTAAFEAKPFVLEAVQRFVEHPTVAWRGLIVDLRLFSRPELVWSSSLPKGWDEGLPAPWAESLKDALGMLQHRYQTLTEERWADYGLRTLECAECRAERIAAIPTNLPAWQYQSRLTTWARCKHAGLAIRAMGLLTRAHPELTFELLGWIEPAGARATEEGPPATRFALTGPVMEALLAPWLIDEHQRAAPRTTYRGYRTFDPPYRYARGWWREPKDPKRPLLPREQANGVSFAATAWGVTGEPEALVAGDAAAPEPALDGSAAPVLETAAAMPGERVRKSRAKKAAKGK